MEKIYYQSTQADSPIIRLEALPEDPQKFLINTSEGKQAEAVASLEKAGFTVTLQSESGLIQASHSQPNEGVQAIAQDQHLTQTNAPTPKKQIDWMGVRGYLGTAGQVAMLVAADKENNTGLKTPTIISLLANASTAFYGDQKGMDTQRLGKIYEATDRIMGQRLDIYLPMATRSAAREANRKEGGAAFNDFMQANNTRITEIAKVAAKGTLALQGDNVLDRTMGRTQLAAKMFSIFAFEKDTINPNKPRSLFTKFMEKGNTWAAILEFSAQGVNLVQSLYTPFVYNSDATEVREVLTNVKKVPIGLDKNQNPILKSGAKGLSGLYKKPSEIFSKQNARNLFSKETAIVSRWRFAGTMLFLAGFTAKMFAPTSVKKIDWKTVNRYSAQALAQLPSEKRPEAMLELAQSYLDISNDPHLTLGTIYQGMQKELEESLGSFKSSPKADKAVAEKAAKTPPTLTAKPSEQSAGHVEALTQKRAEAELTAEQTSLAV